ncbi:MAG: HD-GYP domain-containing protein [Solirubrobacterales bacterium]|nr:HD-GYP domain-containing protein [Solirubrobacterales bacterium]
MAAAVAIAACGPSGHLNLLALCLTAGLYLAARRLRVPAGTLWTAPTVLALLPMLILLPPALVPLIVIGCELAYTVLPGGTVRASFAAVLRQTADAGLAITPALVLLAAGPRHFSWTDWPVYLLAIASQVVPNVLGVGRYWIARGAKPIDLRGFLWVSMTDLCLACVALPIAAVAATHGSVLVLLTVPALVLVSVMATERNGRVENSQALSEAYRGTAELLGDVIEDDDSYTGEHSRQVAELSVAVCDRLGLDATTRRNVEFGALLHDVGKLRVPNDILQKAGKLDEAEWDVMRLHTADGEAMLQVVGGVLSDVGRVVRHSHERFDGNGYPDRLAGEQIPIESRIISACDAWNAMTTSRSYRQALSEELALEELRRCAGTHFDPNVVRALLEEVAEPYATRSIDLTGLPKL